MASHEPDVPSQWARYGALLARCTDGELTSAILLGDDGRLRNVFSVLTFTEQSSPRIAAPALTYITAKPERVPGTTFRLVVARSEVTARDAARAIPVANQFVEPVKGISVACPGTWADPTFVGQEVHRLDALVPDVGAQFWVFQLVPSKADLRKLIGEPGFTWIAERILALLGRSLITRSEYMGSFLIVLPEYRAAIRVDRGEQGRVGIEFRGDKEALRPVVHARASRNEELCSATLVEIDGPLTVLPVGATDFEDVELYDLKSGLLLDRHAGTPNTGMNLTIHDGEDIAFDVVLHDETGEPSGDPVQVQARWGRTIESNVDERSEWQRLQRQSALLDEQRRLHQTGRLFFYSGLSGERAKAIEDVRGLIRTYAKQKLWVWDPYFGGREALEFLPAVADPSTAVRVLTSLAAPPGGTHQRQDLLLRDALAALKLPRGRGPGMTGIEVKVGGRRSHDRFLITDVSCWQIGTSFNQLGNVYSTVVEFPYVDIVREAFEREWKVAQARF